MDSNAISFGAAWTDRRKNVTTVDNQYTTSCNYCGYPFTFGQIGADVVLIEGDDFKGTGPFENFSVVDDIAAMRWLPMRDFHQIDETKKFKSWIEPIERSGECFYLYANTF